jgi:hypothetical protein
MAGKYDEVMIKRAFYQFTMCIDQALARPAIPTW